MAVSWRKTHICYFGGTWGWRAKREGVSICKGLRRWRILVAVRHIHVFRRLTKLRSVHVL